MRAKFLSHYQRTSHGDEKNKKKYIVNAVLYLLIVLFMLVKFSATKEIALANLFLGYSIYTDMECEILENTAEKQVANERWWLGVLIGIGVLLVMTLVYAGGSLMWRWSQDMRTGKIRVSDNSSCVSSFCPKNEKKVLFRRVSALK